MREFTPPQRLDLKPGERTLFLAGSIDRGGAENWQQKACRLLRESDWTILNPRREAWDASWKEDIHEPNFREQVEWELAAIQRADRVLFYFDPETRSPLSLLELGLCAKSGKALVVCPAGFWKKGNVDIVCATFGIDQVATLEEAIARYE